MLQYLCCWHSEACTVGRKRLSPPGSWESFGGSTSRPAWFFIWKDYRSVNHFYFEVFSGCDWGKPTRSSLKAARDNTDAQATSSGKQRLPRSEGNPKGRKYTEYTIRGRHSIKEHLRGGWESVGVLLAVVVVSINPPSNIVYILSIPSYMYSLPYKSILELRSNRSSSETM